MTTMGITFVITFEVEVVELDLKWKEIGHEEVWKTQTIV